MSRTRMIAMVGATVASAVGIGAFMQQGETVLPVQETNFESIQKAAPVDPEQEATLDIQGITLTSAMLNSQGDQARPLTQPNISSIACAVSVTATPAPMATVDLVVLAPCFGNDRVTIHHNGMMFTDATDINGTLAVTVPVLTENAVFIVAFANGKGAVAMAQVPDLGAYDRVVLQWSGKGGFQIHAREFGADYDTEGHIWLGMQEFDTATQHGNIIRLGDANALSPQLAEVYTFPSGRSHSTGVVSMTIETEVTKGNCGYEVAAQTLEVSNGFGLRTRDMVLAVPDCDAIGDFLVLNNLVNDMKITAN